MTFEGLSPEVIIKLGENEVKSRDDLADLATDELMEILGESEMKEREAEQLIMKAREHWFADQGETAEAAENDNGDAEAQAPADAASNA